MGTTITTNLGLIKPDKDEPIPNWPTQNGTNCDKLDALFRGSNATWTPAWTADSVNPVLGTSGFVDGKYLRLWPKMVIAYFRIYTGTASFTGGTGTYRLSLPVAMASGLSSIGIMPIGRAMLRDESTVSTSQNFTINYDHSNSKLFLANGAGVLWAPTTPITLAVDDRLSGWFMYPTDAA